MLYYTIIYYYSILGGAVVFLGGAFPPKCSPAQYILKHVIYSAFGKSAYNTLSLLPTILYILVRVANAGIDTGSKCKQVRMETHLLIGCFMKENNIITSFTYCGTLKMRNYLRNFNLPAQYID